MSTIDMPGGGEYGLPEQVKFGDTNVPKKTTEYYEAPENSRQRPRFGDGEILFAQADTKKACRKPPQRAKTRELLIERQR